MGDGTVDTGNDNQNTVATKENVSQDVKDDSLLNSGNENKDDSLLGSASDAKTQEVLDAEKKLLETQDDQLSAEDKVKKDELVKADEKAKDEELLKNVPEKYEIKMPEGQELDKGLLEIIVPEFKNLKFNNEQAQAVAELLPKVDAYRAEQQKQAFDAFVVEQKEATIKALNEEYGANFKETALKYVAKARDTHFSKETLAKLSAAGFSNDLDLMRDMIKIGKKLSEDSLVSGKPASGEKSAADTFYDKK